MDSATKILSDYLRKVIYEPENAVLDLQELPEEFRDFGKVLIYFCNCIIESAELAKSISKGNLNIKLPSSDNEIAAPLKSLHASLKHLTWQTQRVAKGDYQQRVDFMGDFSEAFNTMVEQLEQRRMALLNEIHVLMQNKRQYEALVGQIEQWIIVTDTDTFESLFVSRDMDLVLTDKSKDWKEELYKWIKAQAEVMKGKNGVHVREIELPVNDTIQHYSVSIYPLVWDKHDALAFVFTDVSYERERLKNLQKLADYDILTNLHNRRCGMEILDIWISEKRNFILSFLDIDNVKFVNDRFGHLEGDRYIIYISDKIREFSSDAIVCRIGGDEFMMLVENWNIDEAQKRLEALQDDLLSCNRDEGDICYEQSISYGIIQVDQNNTFTPSELLSLADEKMYEYKRAYKMRNKNRLKQ